MESLFFLPIFSYLQIFFLRYVENISFFLTYIKNRAWIYENPRPIYNILPESLFFFVDIDILSNKEIRLLQYIYTIIGNGHFSFL